MHDTSEIDTIRRFQFGNLDLGHSPLGGAKLIDMVSKSKQMLIFFYSETHLHLYKKVWNLIIAKF
jgi:hypothetical protein